MSELGEATLIVTPTYNERENLEAFVGAVRRVAPRADVLIVDDASPDGTGEVAERLARQDPRVRVLHRARKLGLGSAYVEAFRRGLGQHYRYFFEMDADLSHDPEFLPSFFAAFERGADVVLGSRNVPGGRIEGWGPGRHLLSRGGSLYARLVLGVAIRDMTTGYKAFTRAALSRIELGRVHSNGYSFQIETTYRALMAGLSVVEIPIVFVDRRAGQSNMDARICLEAVAVAFRLRAETRRRGRR